MSRVEVKRKVKLSDPVFTYSNKFVRVLWWVVYNTVFRFSPVPFHKFRILLLKLFGADIRGACAIYPSVVIWLPSNLSLGKGSTLGPRVRVYNQGHIKIADNAIISQGVHLCASTHDYNNCIHPLILAPITIGENVWICADAFIGPNVAVAEGTVVGARAVLSKNTNPWSVYAGNPALKVNERSRF